jgi:bifunctional DNA-binding transcriptional regulator/antitoxin component of YhaV-PrlF toxin-antitoxin module
VAKITSKLQVTIPKALAERYGLTPGREIAFLPAGDAIRVVPEGRSQASAGDVGVRLELFDQATRRQRARDVKRRAKRPPSSRGWRREQLYTRGRPGRH